MLLALLLVTCGHSGVSPGPVATCGEVNVGPQWGQGQNSGHLGLKAWVKLA